MATGRLRTMLVRTIGGRPVSGPAAERERERDLGLRINGFGFSLTDEQIAAGEHRNRVGPEWDLIGKLQFEFLVAEGLQPTSYLVDVGCGALRGGLHFIGYLEPGHYFGVDVNASLLRAGLEHELPAAGLAGRLPPTNLRRTQRFDCDFGVPFDYALAQGVFSHLPLNHIRLCLYQLARQMPVGGRFFASYFAVDPAEPFDARVRQVAVTTQAETDPYHYSAADLEWAAASVGPWTMRDLGDWGHPRGERMAEFTLTAK